MDNLKACKSSNKRQKIMMMENSSSLSKIPDEILIDILSRLSMKEAARTSLVSRQWESLWKFYTGSLEFDCDPETQVLLFNGKRRFVTEETKFIGWVNQVLAALSGATTIQKFRVCFDLGKHQTTTIDSWIRYVAARKVRKLELCLSSMLALDKPCILSLEEIYNFATPGQLMKKNNDLGNLKSLISLRLESVDVTDEHVSYFLSEWPFLEELAIAYSPSLHNLKVAGGGDQLLKLKYLEVRYCMGLGHLEVTAAASNLASFNYGGPMINMIFQDVPRLSSFSLDSDYCEDLVHNGFKGLPFQVSQLQMLTLDLGWMMCCFRFPCLNFPKLFTSLRHLELVFRILDEGTMLFVASFLRASPCLHKLVLKYKIDSFHTERMKRDPSNLEFLINLGGLRKQLVKKGYKYECLKEVDFLGWNGLKRDIEFVTHLIEASRSLERVTFDPCDPFRVGIMKGLPLPPDKLTAEDDARNRARDLESKFSPNTKLVVASKCHCC
ncbi:hypothetical protein ACH5RR_035660 [Cinchona calisaya]|uniref:F-box domain-containing protein n=1 Tax=Cinchona calisaya TaxID=153742 RepID=A0ABD2Y2F8_9GENT